MIPYDLLEKYRKHIQDDYDAWTVKARANGYVPSFFVIYKSTRKYIKFITTSHGSPSVHSWIVLEDDGKFKRGDILKAASWKTPALNFARGNIFDIAYPRVTWTGAS